MNLYTFFRLVQNKVGHLFSIPFDISKDNISSKERYKLDSLAQVLIIEKILNQCNESFMKFKSILDFGCGWGRFNDL